MSMGYEMRKFLWILPIMLISCIGVGFSVNHKAYAEIPEEFRTAITDGEAEVMGYVDSNFDGNLIIPATVFEGSEEYPLVKLSKGVKDSAEYTAFINNSEILSLDLTNASNLQVISSSTFNKCTSMSGELRLPSSLLTIEENAFKNVPIEKVYITRCITENGEFVENGFTNISSTAFSGNSDIIFVFPSQEVLDLYKGCEIFSTGTYTMIVESGSNPGEGEDEGGGNEENVQVEISVEFYLNYDTSASIAPLTRVLGGAFNYTKQSDVWAEDTSYTFPEIEREGCEFVGWALSPNGDVISETDIIEESIVEENKVVLYAIWQEKFYTITYHYTEDFTPSAQLPDKFGYLTGVDLPSLTCDTLTTEWLGWYIEDETTPTTRVPAGISHNIEVWSRYTNYQPHIDITSKMASGEDVSDLYFNDEVDYFAEVLDYPDGCEITYEWKIYDNTWSTIGTSSECRVGSKLPKQYTIMCKVILSKDGKTAEIENSVLHNVKKWDINIDWKSTPNLTYTGENYIHAFDITYSNDFIKDSCIVKTLKKVDGEYIECDEVIGAGEYKIVVAVKDAYQSIAQIVDDTELCFTINKSTISTSYGLESFTKEYDGQLYIPEITQNNENWSEINFDISKINQSVYYKKASTYHLLTKHKLSENVDLTSLINAGQYYFELSIDDENYKLVSAYPKQIVLVSPKRTLVSWSNVNLVYNGEMQAPTAIAKDINGKNLELELSGAKKEAGENVGDLYVATVSVADPNYSISNPTCNFYIAKAKSFIRYEAENNSIIKLYDGKKYKITASAYDDNGKIADNVVVACESDLTSIGKHTIVMTWSGDSNHFAAQSTTLIVTIKTENIIIEKDAQDIVVSSSDGFESVDEVGVENNNVNLVSKSVYNTLNSAYDIHDIYRITNTKSKDLTISLALPSGITSSKQLKVFEILENGDMKEVEYLIKDGSISLQSSSETSTFAVVCVKDNTSVAIILGCGLSVVACGVVVMLVIIKKRKNKTI